MPVETATALHQDLARSVMDLLAQDGAQPGAILRQDALAARLGVSRTPIRGALAVLVAAGRVEARGRSLVLRGAPAPTGQADDPVARLPVTRLMVRIARDRSAGRLPDSLSEADLQRHTQATRSVTTQALRRLADLGIVTRNRGHGWRFIAGLATPAERDAAYRFRVVMEPAALLEPGYALPPGFAAAMRRGHQAFLDQPWQDSRAVAFFELNASFHHGIVAGSGNRFFIAAAEQHNRLRRLLNYGWVLGADRVRQSVVEHLAILDALEHGGMPVASAKLAQHLHAAAALGGELARLRGVA